MDDHVRRFDHAGLRQLQCPLTPFVCRSNEPLPDYLFASTFSVCGKFPNNCHKDEHQRCTSYHGRQTVDAFRHNHFL